MARPVVKQEEPEAITAAAALPMVRGSRARTTKSQKAAAWQSEAWGFYDTIGELRYATNWFSNALSRAELYAARKNPDGTLTRLTSGLHHDILQTVLGDNESEKLKEFGKHYFIPGEFYLVGREKDGKEVFEVYSSQEMKYVNGVWEIKPGGNRAETIRLDGPDDFVERIWKAHPTSHHEPDSPVRAILPNLREIAALTAHIAAQTSSRLAGAGMAFFPSEIEVPPPPGQTFETTNSADNLMQLLQQVMAAAVANPGSPESLVPIILTMPGELIEKVSKLTFWSELDENAAAMREKAIARAALGLDMPPEVLTGTADLNHWGGWQVEESSIKAHIEPALDTIVAALTRCLFTPLREEDDEVIVVAYDTSKLRLRPNRSREAIELWDRGAISLPALLRETGFAGDEASREDIKLFILLKMASGSATPEMVVEAAKALGVSDVQASGAEMRESRPAPSLEEHPSRDLPDGVDLGALKVVMMRAMERAGNRIKNRVRGAQFSMVAAADLYRHVQPSTSEHDALLEDAWSFLPRVVPPQHVELVETALNRYARTILTAQLPITEDGIRDHLAATLAARTHKGDD